MGWKPMPLLASILFGLFTGCGPPDMRLSFPEHPLYQADQLTWYAGRSDGLADFATSFEPDGRIDRIYFSNHHDGHPDRMYRLSEYADADVPHVIVLLDSVPYQSVVDYYAAGHFRFCAAPRKVIPPFPSLTEVVFSDVLHAPPLPGMIDQSYDARTNHTREAFWNRVYGYSQPWERRVDFHEKFWEEGMGFLDPRPWYASELERARRAIEESAEDTTIVYSATASCMACRYGQVGIDQTLAGAERLCLELIHDHHGAIKITLMADHGHNLVPSTNVPMDEYLTAAGYHCGASIDGTKDVVVEVNGLVTYAGVQTRDPVGVADVLARHGEFELIMYQVGDRVCVRDGAGIAWVESKNGRVRYLPETCDVLQLSQITAAMKSAGTMDGDGYASDADWLAATADAHFPDGPRRVWDAFHRQAVSMPGVMVTLEDGYCAGLKEYEKYIHMESTHGGLNQVNSATFVMSMQTPTGTGPLRSRDVLRAIAPGFEPTVRAVVRGSLSRSTGVPPVPDSPGCWRESVSTEYLRRREYTPMLRAGIS